MNWVPTDFMLPAAFLLSLLLGVIVLMYLLRLRRTRRVISSIYLWKRMVRDVEANTPWQRLRKSWLLFLQLLFLIFLIISIARPYKLVEGFGGKAAVLIIDSSASMAAVDVKPDRLGVAKSQAREIVERLPEDARVTVIAAGSRAQILIASSTDRRQAAQAIRSIQITHGESDLAIALQLAFAIAARQPDTRVFILSDGNAQLPEQIASSGIVEYLPIGIRDKNQAINLLSLQPTSRTLQLSAFIQVENYSDTPAERRLAIYADGNMIDVYDLNIASGQVQAVLADNIPSETRLVEARLLDAPQVDDDLDLDDRALVINRQAGVSNITLITPGNIFLETALALLPGYQLTTINTTNVAAPGNQLVEIIDAELTVIDRSIPPTMTIPSGNILFISPEVSNEFFVISGVISEPIPYPSEYGSLILENVLLDDVHILDSARIPLPEWAEAVIITNDGQDEYPLLFTGERENRRIAVLCFSLFRSDLPLQVAYPVLMSNLVGWLAPRDGGEVPVQVAPGELVKFAVPPDQTGGKAISIKLPDGTFVTPTVEDGAVLFSDTHALGIYQIYLDNDLYTDFVVNFLSPLESDLRPAENLNISGIINSQTTPEAHVYRRESWRVWVIIALILLVTEWFLYHRPVILFLTKRFQTVRLLSKKESI